MRMLAALAGLLLPMVLFGGGVASAASLPLTEFSCGPGGDWRCYATNSDQQLIATFDEPHAEWTIDLVLPADPENWSLIGIAANLTGIAKYALTYPDSSHSGGATLSRIAFVDSTGFEFAAAARGLSSFCGARADGSWVCTDGDIMGGGMKYGVGYPSASGGPLDPTVPPLVGPVTLSVDWSVYGDPPESSSLEMDGAWFGYVLAPVPEPGTGLLLNLGILGIALARRGHRVGRRAASRFPD